jgi:dTMP kinase
MDQRGLFIVFEGGEGAGKTTQVKLLADTLRAARPGHEVVTTAEPGGTDLGARIRALVLDCEAMDPRAETLLYLADRAEHIARVIRPALERGATVISDRFHDSTLVYQGYARGLGLHRIEELSTWILGPVRPDLVIVLDVDPTVGLARAGRRSDTNRFEAEKLAFHHRVRTGFLALVAEQQKLRAGDSEWGTRTPYYFVVDARQDVETVAHEVQKLASTLIAEQAIGNAR